MKDIVKLLDSDLRDLSNFREVMTKLHYYTYKAGISDYLNEHQKCNVVANKVLDDRLTKELKKLNYDKFIDNAPHKNYDPSKWWKKPPKIDYSKLPKVEEVVKILENNEENRRKAQVQIAKIPNKYFIEGIMIGFVKNYWIINLSKQNCGNLRRYLYSSGENADVVIIRFLTEFLDKELTEKDLDRIAKLEEIVATAKEKLEKKDKIRRMPIWARKEL